ncbi:acyl-CoA dehydrogenase family protein [Methylobacterium sp. NEAU 140]|uniref:acyl-CoA dehydrogenase family protein n=1 Tax=Methylobacterium sp. NEAU 140 TaxID=3064945 RepID=UPI0027330357|nr:acyl-CoA dehydrogenase family protein [Methylobacterium sp. NEAU 140]MDP4021479.1 acyl-CoA dehydrogenase family protein [Methylobacterium sp. NEAU 140]
MEPETAPDDVAGIVLDQAGRLFSAHITPALLAACDGASGPAAWPAPLWEAIDESGLPLALVPEARGGIGLDATVAARLIRACGRAALPLPLPETIAGAALWAAAGGEAGAGALSLVPAAAGVRIAPSGDGFSLDGRAAGVPWGGGVSALLVEASGADGRCLVRLEAPGPATDTRHNLAGEPRDALDLAGRAVPADAVRPLPGWLAGAEGGAIETVGAWIRAEAMVGAMERALASSLDHATERQQFGRPLAKFQAIQHMLADAAGHLAAATAAADLAAAAWGGTRFPLAVAVAKSRCGEAAGRVAEICHQVHGAMGFTQEHGLHRATRRLWSWRDEFGPDVLWQERIGRAVCAGGGAALWPMLVRLRAGAG